MKLIKSVLPLPTLMSLLVAGNVAADVEQEFKLCASAALESRVSEETTIHVDFSGVEPDRFSTGVISTSSVRLELDIVDGSTGMDLGTAVCVLNRAGDVVSSRFEPNYVAMN